MAEGVVDTTIVPVGETNDNAAQPGGNSPDPSPGAEANTNDGSSASSDTVPFDQDPKWQSARAAEKNLNELLESKGFGSIEDLVTALEKGSALEENLSGRDLTEILESHETLQEYQRIWAEEERNKQLEGETPADTIARLEREKKELEDTFNKEKSAQTAAQEAVEAVKQYNSDVNTFVGKQDLPEEYHSFASLLMGADNPMLDVDMTDNRAFTASATSVIDQLKAFEQSVIERYKAGRTELPPTPPADGGNSPAPGPKRKPIKNLAEAKKVALERLIAARKQ